jgi:hypothetical protein
VIPTVSSHQHDERAGFSCNISSYIPRFLFLWRRPTHWICKVILLFLHLIIDLGVFGRHLAIGGSVGHGIDGIENRASDMWWTSFGKTYLRLLRTFPVYMREDETRRNGRTWLHEVLLRRNESRAAA